MTDDMKLLRRKLCQMKDRDRTAGRAERASTLGDVIRLIDKINAGGERDGR